MSRPIGLAILMTIALIGIKPIASTEPKINSAGDARIRMALEELNLEYEVSQQGNFTVAMRLPNGRKQFAWIISDTEADGNSETRKIVSPVYLSNQPLSPEIDNQLRKDNSTKKLGAWQRLTQNEQTLAVFAAKIPAEQDAQSLKDSLAFVMGSADEKEQQLTGKDEF
jgi:hypothetical protein